MADLGFWTLAQKDPSYLALVDPDGREIASGELLAAANQLVHGLRELGLQEGDSFATVLPNGAPMIELYLAALQAGWYLVPINHHLVGPEIAYVVDDCGAKALIVDERPLGDEPIVIQQFRRRLERTRITGRLRTVSQGVAEVQQRASSAVPMDATVVAELQQQGAVLHELVGGPAPSLNVPAVESSPDPGGPQGVHTNE